MKQPAVKKEFCITKQVDDNRNSSIQFIIDQYIADYFYQQRNAGQVKKGVIRAVDGPVFYYPNNYSKADAEAQYKLYFVCHISGTKLNGLIGTRGITLALFNTTRTTIQRLVHFLRCCTVLLFSSRFISGSFGLVF